MTDPVTQLNRGSLFCPQLSGRAQPSLTDRGVLVADLDGYAASSTDSSV
jgi:hypothetical protein